jgi:flagellar basal-body rod protein FlgG
MIDALHISASGLRSQQQQIDVISNNVANLQTPGFKKGRVAFAAMTQTGEGAMALEPTGQGVEIVGMGSVFTAGPLQPTGNPLDVAVDGAGLLEVIDASGERFYTRAGRLQVDSEGFLALPSGHRLSAGIQIPPDAGVLRINDNGDVVAKLAGVDEETLLGAIEIAMFPSMDGLKAIGNNLFAATDASGDVAMGAAGSDGFGGLQQGYVETSNVDLVDEMTALVLAQRAYQLNARVLQASDQILETINNLRR